MIDDIVNLVIIENPDLFEKAKADDSYIGALRNECMKHCKTVSPLQFSQALRRRIDGVNAEDNSHID